MMNILVLWNILASRMSRHQKATVWLCLSLTLFTLELKTGSAGGKAPAKPRPPWGQGPGLSTHPPLHWSSSVHTETLELEWHNIKHLLKLSFIQMLKCLKQQRTQINISESNVEQRRGPEPYVDEFAPSKTVFNLLWF